VDEPLRKMGFTQTWGPSIFLFTAGEWLADDDLVIDVSSIWPYCIITHANSFLLYDFLLCRCSFALGAIFLSTKQILWIHESS
jgi:hypothetical protein